MREAIFDILTGDADFSAVVDSERIHQTNIAGIDEEFILDPKDGLWATYEIDGTEPGISDVDTVRVTLTVFDAPGSYLRIDNAIILARRALAAAIPTWAGGVWVMRYHWEGTGVDAYDDTMRQISRDATWTMVGRQTLTA